jgi:hypothetical protein
MLLLSLVLLQLERALLPALLRPGDSMAANLPVDGHDMTERLLPLLSLLLVRVIAAPAAALLPLPAAAEPLELLCCMLALRLAGS